MQVVTLHLENDAIPKTYRCPLHKFSWEVSHAKGLDIDAYSSIDWCCHGGFN